MVRPRKPTAPPAFPLVPHYHTCRSMLCSARHKWTCKETRCSWSLMMDCITSAAAAEHFNTDA